FFQAEDGIRDFHVTGVQTCALPISANEALEKGDIDEFLSFCTDDTEWVFIGEKTLKGKEAVKQYLEEAYTETTQFTIERMIEEGDFVVQVGEISFENKNGRSEERRV